MLLLRHTLLSDRLQVLTFSVMGPVSAHNNRPLHPNFHGTWPIVPGRTVEVTNNRKLPLSTVGRNTTMRFPLLTQIVYLKSVVVLPYKLSYVT